MCSPCCLWLVIILLMRGSYTYVRGMPPEAGLPPSPDIARGASVYRWCMCVISIHYLCKRACANCINQSIALSPSISRSRQGCRLGERIHCMSHLAGQEMQGVRPCFNDLVFYMIKYAASRRDCMSSNMSQGICCPWCLCCLLGSGHGSGSGRGIG